MSRSTRHDSHKRDDGGQARVEASKVYRDPAPEKRQQFPSTETRRGVADHPALCGVKRKDREEERRVAAGSAADKRSKSDAVEASARPKPPCVDSRGREKHEEASKHRSEKDASPSGSGGQCKEGKEREKERERGSLRNKSVRDSRNQRPDAVSGRKRGAETGGSEAERVAMKDKENTEWHIQDAQRNPELEKELEKRIRSRDGFSDKDKRQEDGRVSGDRRSRDSDDRRCVESDDRRCRESDDRRLSSRDDRRSGNYRNESHRDGRYRRDKYWEDLDKNHRYHDDRQCDERSSSNHANDSCHIKDTKEDIIPESHFKKSKLRDSDHDGVTYVEVQRTKSTDNRGRKRSSDENEDLRDLRLQGNKQPRGDIERNASNTFKLDSHVDRGRSEYRHTDKVHSSVAYSRSKNSHNTDVMKDQSRCILKQGESTQRELSSQVEFRGTSASTVNHGSILGFCKKDSEPRSWEKNKPNDCMNPCGSVQESAGDPKYDRTSRSDGHISPIKLTEKSTSTSDRQDSTRSATRHNLDSKDTGHISSIPKDGRDSTMNCSVFKGNHSLTGMQNKEHIPARSSSVSRVGHFSGSSPRSIPQPSPVRLRSGSLSDLGPYGDDNRYQTRDRKPTSCHKQNDDYITSRPQGNVWSTLAWPPVANGPPFQHGPRPPFHSVLGQFPAPSLFGLREHTNMNLSIREHMHMNPTKISYHGHEAGNRFSRHGHPFGWHDSADMTCSQLQQWGGNNNVFSEEPHVYRCREWDQNIHQMGSGGWDRNSAVWKGKNNDFYMDLPTPQEPEYSSGSLVEDGLVGKSGHVSQAMHTQPAFVPDEITEGKHSDVPPTKHAIEAPPMTMNKKTTKPSQILSGASTNFCCTYLLELDVSVGLTCPELYKHCMILLGTRDANVDCSSKHGFPQLVKEDAEAAAKSTNYTSSIFPKMTDAVFQKAMSIYKNQIEATRLKFPVPYVLPKEETDFPDASHKETVKTPAHQTLEVMLEANADAATHSEEDPNTICGMEADVPGNAKEHQPDVISDAIVFVEVGSQECEAIVPECRVNLRKTEVTLERIFRAETE